MQINLELPMENLHKINCKRKKSILLPCFFCCETDNTVLKPKFESYKNLQNAILRRKDDFLQKFHASFIDAKNVDQTFSWHRDCYANYTSVEK